MMLKKITLTNFQKHKNLNIDCGKITAVTGKSDSGKSAIIRALNWLVFNRPTSNNYPSHWIKNENGNLIDESSIKIELDNNVITRFKNKTDNGYKLNNDILKAVKTDIPDNITKILNMSDVNIQKQLDSHFLLSETAGQIAKFFNDLTGLNEIDKYLSAVDSLKRQTTKDIKFNTENIEQLEIEIDKYSWLEKAEKLNNELNIINDELNKINISRLEKELEQYNNLNNKLYNFIDISNLENLYLSLTKTDNNIKENNIKIDSLVKQLELYNKYSKYDFNYGKAETLLNRVNIYQEKINNIDFDNLKQDLNIYNNCNNKLQYLLPELENLNKKLPNICPLCNQKLKETL